MAWEEIRPRAGVRSLSGGVSVAWRQTSSRAMEMLVVTIGVDVARQLGLEPGGRVSVQRDKVAGLLRLVPGPSGWRAAWKAGCASFAVPLDGFSSDKRRAEAAPHRVEDGALIVTLPDWAAPMRAGVQRAAAAAEQARARITGRAA